MSVKIIIVDDHDLFLDGLTSIFTKEIGIEVIGVSNNGLESLKLLESGLKPDVILSDIRMPIIDGITLVKLLKTDYPHIPVIILSMFDQNADMFEMYDAGVKGYVPKKTNKKTLIEAIHTVSKGELYFEKSFLDIYKKHKANNEYVEEIVLTKREREILQLIVKGRSSLQIADELKLSKFTIDTHRKNIHKKTGIKNNINLIRHAQQWL